MLQNAVYMTAITMNVGGQGTVTQSLIFPVLLTLFNKAGCVSIVNVLNHVKMFNICLQDTDFHSKVLIIHKGEIISAQ